MAARKSRKSKAAKEMAAEEKRRNEEGEKISGNRHQAASWRLSAKKSASGKSEKKSGIISRKWRRNIIRRLGSVAYQRNHQCNHHRLASKQRRSNIGGSVMARKAKGIESGEASAKSP